MLVVAVLLFVCVCCCAVAGWGWAWCCVVRLTQVIVVVAVRSCEALWRPFVGSVYSGVGVGVEGAEIGCGGFLWGCVVCASTRAAAGGGV